MAELPVEGQIHFNGDMRFGTYAYVTGKRRKAEIDGDDDESPVPEMFHEMLPELTDSLILTAKRYAKSSRRGFFDSLRRQKESRETKQGAN